MTDTNTLAPCPFCGERAETDFIPEHHSYQVECSDSIGCTARITRDSELGAIEAWNCRAALAAPAQAMPAPGAQLEAVGTGGWLRNGALLYRLTDERRPANFDEIRVTMANGSRDIGQMSVQAERLLAMLTAPQPPTSAEPTQPAAWKMDKDTFQFLSDVMTAAGLVEHGKQCKALAKRLNSGVMAVRETFQARWAPDPDQKIVKVDCGDYYQWQAAPAQALPEGRAALITAAPQPAAQALDADLWYLQDTRSYVGNDVVWWAKDGKGYTTDVSKAHAYGREEAFRQAAMRGTDRAWPKAYIDGKTRPAVDMQYIDHAAAIAAQQGEAT